MFIKKAILFVVLAMAGVFLTVAISVPGYPYALDKAKVYQFGKWYRYQVTNDIGDVNKYTFIVNEDKMMLYFSSMGDGKVIAVGFKSETSNLQNKPPMYKSRMCCWHDVDFIFEGEKGRILLQDQDWIWAIGAEKVVETSMMRNVLENNEVKFQYYIKGRNDPVETQFKFDSDELMENIRWMLNDPTLKIEYTE